MKFKTCGMVDNLYKMLKRVVEGAEDFMNAVCDVTDFEDVRGAVDFERLITEAEDLLNEMRCKDD